ncbi:MAG: SDR family oxidoreductase [Bacillota bacterium]
MKKTKILILGITGMLGHALFARLSKCRDFDVFGTARDTSALSKWFSPELLGKTRGNVNADNIDTITRTIADIRPDIVINAIGIIKQAPAAQDPLKAIAVNALLPHRIALLCKAAGARLIHISTDCVFSGGKGRYIEDDIADAVDLYGRTKLLGEVVYPHCITLRTSIIGHELKGKHGLVEWFLAQEGEVRGFSRVMFSGLPTVELARVIADYVIPDGGLNGLYQVSSHPISKYDLLRLVADRYRKTIVIEPEASPSRDRTLDSTLFRRSTGYTPPEWPELVDAMYCDYATAPYYRQTDQEE